MYLHEMNERQRREEENFVEKLKQSNWDTEPFASLLHDGTYVSPEGNASLKTDDVELTLEYYAEEESFVLVIFSPKEGTMIRLKFLFGSHFEQVLDWVVTRQQELNLKSFPKLLKKVYAYCDIILLLEKDGTAHRIEI